VKPTVSETGSKAIVLGGGGVTGIAWLTGVLLGLEEEGVALRSTDLVVGTSAGSAVGAQLAGDTPLRELYERQVDPARQVGERKPDIRYLALLRHVVPALLRRSDTRRLRARIGRMAVEMGTGEALQRRSIIADRLPSHDWPAIPLAVSAIDASTGEQRWFDRASGVGLVDAVAASCAVPGVWPPVQIEGRPYYDGGIPSPDNASRAEGFASVLLVSPLGATRSGALSKRLAREIAALEEGGSRTTIVTPDSGSRAAIGRNALDPANRPVAAEAGLAQGRHEAERVREGWR
jgi:NTE family protein